MREKTRLQPVYRVYTEDIQRKSIIRILSKKFDNFMLQPTTGYFRGKPEASIVIEIVGAADSQIKWVAEQIRKINQQSSILVIAASVRSRRIRSSA